MKFFNKTVTGYYLNPADLSSYSGVYFVYRGKYNPLTNQVVLSQLVYIGEAVDINSRVSCHDRFNDWKRQLQSGEVLCWSQCLEPIDRKTLEAALIFKHKPLLNKEYVNQYTCESASIILTGATIFLNTNFTVTKQVTSSLYA